MRQKNKNGKDTFYRRRFPDGQIVGLEGFEIYPPEAKKQKRGEEYEHEPFL